MPGVTIKADRSEARAGDRIQFTAKVEDAGSVATYTFDWRALDSNNRPITTSVFKVVANGSHPPGGPIQQVEWETTGLGSGTYLIEVIVTPRVRSGEQPQPFSHSEEVHLRESSSADPTHVVKEVIGAALDVFEARRLSYRGAPLPVTLRRTSVAPTPDEVLWMVIRKTTDELSFPRYVEFIDTYLCRRGGSTDNVTAVRDMEGRTSRAVKALQSRVLLPFSGVEAYRRLKAATEAFMLVNTGVLVNFSESDILEEERRTGHAVEGTIANLWDAYLERVNGVKLSERRAWPPRTPAKEVGAAAGPAAEVSTARTYAGLPAEPAPGPEEYKALPYLAAIRAKLPDVPLLAGPSEQELIDCYGILQQKLNMPVFVELIWSYWHEEGMLIQTMNHISQRFQNVRPPGRDPLATLEIDPLRPINNLLWGYVQDEQHRLSVIRRASEYDHEYGFTLHGKAVSGLRTVDRRSKFIESFHNLLHQCTQFFRQDDDTTVVADGFPVLNSVKETHYLLAQGAHNQFGDLPSTARQEMLMQMWLLSRPEMREFLGGRVMVPYPEPWMDRVDAMKSLQGWTDTSVVHFHDLAVFGEKLLLSIRYGGWSTVNDPQQAANWARYWRPEVQGYIHAYRTVTGVDLTAELTDQQRLAERYVAPSELLFNRLALQRRR